MEKFSKDYSTIFNTKPLSLIDYLESDTKSECRLTIHIDISDLKLKLKTTKRIIGDLREILSYEIDWNTEVNRQIRNEAKNFLAKLYPLYRVLNCHFNALSNNRLAESNKLKIILCGTRKISAKIDSYFKCILGHYRGKYRRITVTSNMSFINASSVCRGEA